MSAREQAQEQLVALAQELLLAAPGGRAEALAGIAALRAEVDRIADAAAAAGGEQAILPPLRSSLAAAHAGLAALLLPDGAGVPALRAGLARLHGLMAALAVTASARAAPPG